MEPKILCTQLDNAAPVSHLLLKLHFIHWNECNKRATKTLLASYDIKTPTLEQAVRKELRGLPCMLTSFEKIRSTSSHPRKSEHLLEQLPQSFTSMAYISPFPPLSFVLLFSFLPDFYNFLLVGAAVLTQTRLHFFVIGPHGM